MSAIQDSPSIPDEDNFSLGEAPQGETPAQPARTPNFVQTEPYSAPLADPNKFEERVVMPSTTQSGWEEAMGNLPDSDPGASENVRHWAEAVQASAEMPPYGRGMERVVEREGAAFQQHVEVGNVKLRGISPNFNPKPGVKPTGDAALFVVRKALGIGSTFMAPMWHSGLWLTVRTPGDDALLELSRQLDAEKISLGRMTYGFLFSNNTSFISQILVDFVIDHVYESSLAFENKDELRAALRLPDLQALVWAMACARWPAGFQYERPCIADPDKCHHVVKEKINPSKLLWVDVNALTEHQKLHMAKRARGSVTKDDIKRYQDEFLRGQPKAVHLKLAEDAPGIQLMLSMCSIAQHLEAGYTWVNGIEQMYGRALMENEKARDQYLLNQGRATLMRQYSHVVSKIIIGDDEYTDVDIINRTLNDISGNDEARTKFILAAREFLDESIVSLVAIPTYTCPACGGHQTGEKHRSFSSLIALDAYQTFFQLHMQRVAMIQARA